MPDNKKLLIIFSLLALTSLGLLWWLILPAVSAIGQNASQIHEQREKLDKLLRQGQSIKENQKNVQAIKNEIGILQKIWLKNGDELEFITDLENTAEKNNLQQTITFDNTKAIEKNGNKVIPLELQLSGSLENILMHLAQIEAFDYYINFQNIELTKQSGEISKKFPGQAQSGEENEQTPSALSMRLSGLTYWK
ncbi:hypothetical protein COZ26_00745 [Candidatus Kuenenbacteria bacterium CG_4_10_14_3_um_filter_39_14]|uniref:Uncharacterized protein n=2 Tax=Candidatus Kueneniibacteriota TaxID=1752740 RepID=A0A2M7MHQ9_9BACT|nr:MAG: hypothetical protein COZ26_00745 [Candidatus Kuenenbacteria bacterium CG_4_10_14_3_um_filter_39_14]